MILWAQRIIATNDTKYTKSLQGTIRFMESARLSGKAVVSLLLGLFPLTGIFGIVVGWVGLREINASEGRIGGRRLTLAGMIAGCMWTILLAAGVGALILLRVRTAAEQLTCKNNLRVIGAALNMYQERNRSYPAGTLPQKHLQPDRRLSWYADLLPFLGRQSLYEKFDLREGWEAEVNRQAVHTPVQGLRCPSYEGEPAQDSSALTEYVGIAGVGENAAQLPVADSLAGVFGYDRKTTVQDVTRGVGYTMMATETALENGPWAAGGEATVRGLSPAQKPYIGRGRPFGGLHRGGLNVLYVDGKVEFVTEHVNPKLFEDGAKIHERVEETEIE